MAKIIILAIAVLAFSPLQALAAAKSCSTFATIKSFDKDAMVVDIKFTKGNQRKFFPVPEGSPNISKLPKKCSGQVKKKNPFPVKATGGRLSVTQIRTNLDGKMLNDTDDAAWLPAQLEKIVADKTTVAVVLRPGLGKDAKMGVTTIYLPITEEEEAEIERRENQAVDVE